MSCTILSISSSIFSVWNCKFCFLAQSKRFARLVCPCIFVVALGLSGCGSLSPSFKGYSGPERPDEEIAILTIPNAGLKFPGAIQFTYVDGVRIPTFKRQKLKLSPGLHVIGYQYKMILYIYSKEYFGKIHFDAKAGHEYIMLVEWSGTGTYARIFDKETREVVAYN